MSYIKVKNGVTTMVRKGSAPEPVKREETLAYRDPIDVVTGTITMAKNIMLSSCKRRDHVQLCNL